MIAPEFLQSCTDEQINKGVAWLQVARSVDEALASEDVELYRYGMNYDISSPRHYCTSPNDAWPVVLENRIGIKPRGVDSDWYAYQGKIEVINSNLLRAAMEVYILMSTQS